MTTSQEALAPVRAELLRAARADAEELLARADDEAAGLLRQARADALAVREQARRQGEADGAAASRDLRTRARREARHRVLGARREAYEELCRRATERVRALRRSADYPMAVEALAGRARGLLGPGAEVVPQPDGGVVARTAGKRVDLTLDALAARALDGIGAEIESLWER
jgi:vacuolar-type H+-ATPase subunit E/Vma4